MTRPVFILGLLLVFASCVPAAKPVSLTTTFDPDEVRWFSQEGENEIKGSALLRQVGGGTVTCAGNEVSLVPVSAYATERMVAMYGNAYKGYSPALALFSFSKPIVFSENDPAYLATRKQVICDTQGFFRFYDLPDGEFFILTHIVWYVNNAPRPQGGALMQRVSLAGGETKEIVLTQ